MSARLLLALACLACAAGALHADTVLTQLTPGATTQALTLYMGSDRCIMTETTRLWVPAGRSELRFRWADANLDAATIGLAAPADVVVSGYRGHRDEPSTYAWDLDAPSAAEREFVATYTLRGITWAATYQLTFDRTAGTATLAGLLHLTNDSRVALRDAPLKLCTSTPIVVEPLGIAVGGERTNLYADLPAVTLAPGCQRRVPFLRMEGIPASVLLRAYPDTAGAEVRRVMQVDLRTTPLPGALPRGHVEVREVSGESTRRLAGADLVQALDTLTELPLGVERRLVFQRTVLANRKTDFEFDRLDRVSGFDTCDDIRDSFRNRTGAPVRVELIERAAGKWNLRSDPAPVTLTAGEARWQLEVPAGCDQDVNLTVVRHSGTRAQ